jgi:pectate lyase
MKFLGAVALLAASVIAAPTPTEELALDKRSIVKRATITDACDIGYASQNGGTKGGAGGTTTTVTSAAQLTAAAESDDAAVIVVKGAISSTGKIRVGSNKSIIGASGSSITGTGFYIKDVSNVILRNLKLSKVKADSGDAIGIQASTNVWVDHCDLSSDMDSGKDYYDGLLDITHASDYVTVSNTYIHDHYKASLVGHSDSNADEDTGHLIVTYANNYWENVNSRGPSIRFGTVHLYNQYYSNIGSGAINTRMGAQILVESSAWVDSSSKAVYSADSKTVGYAVTNDLSLGGSAVTAAKGTLKSVPYSYSLLGSGKASSVASTAGQTLSI